jgi:hypothetical protein
MKMPSKAVRSVPKETRAEIIKEYMLNPLQSTKELCAMFSLPESKVEKVLAHYLPSLRKHDDTLAMVKANEGLMSLAEMRMADKLLDPEANISLSELTNLRDQAFKHNQLLTGGATDRQELRYQGIQINVIQKTDA